MKYRKYFIVILIAFGLFFIVKSLYNYFNYNKKIEYVYVFNEDYEKGIKINENMVTKLALVNNNVKDQYVTDFSSIKNSTLNESVKKGNLLKNSDFLDDSEFILVENNEVLMSINLKNSENLASYQIKKGSIINLIYTGKSEYAYDVVNKLEKSSIVSSKSGATSYITLNVVENVDIKGIYNKNGVDISKSYNNLTQDEKLIDTVLIKIDKETAMVIENLKQYGDFSVVIVK